MSSRFIMLKNDPVIEITDDYKCIILDKDRLPIALRFESVSYDDVYHSWAETRHMSIGRTNAKNILNALRLSQINQYKIAEAMHFATLTDCYWIKNYDENITWEDISLFRSSINQDIAETALIGGAKIIEGKIRTPEPSVLGMSAKAWQVDPKGQLWLYKTSKKELAASIILDILDIPHVPYTQASDEEIAEITTIERLNKIKNSGEIIVKCPIITNEDTSIFTFEDYLSYCEGNGFADDYAYTSVIKDFGIDYYMMQIADFILSNDDRHIGNWGFFMDNSSGKILSLHPLFDHDHAFSTETEIPSQTGYNVETLEEAAKKAVSHVDIKAGIQRLIASPKPASLSDEAWSRVIENSKILINSCV